MTEAKSLEDVGTRFQHLMDLRSVWQDGIEMLRNMKPAHISKADQDLLLSLNVAVSLIDKQVDLMSGYDLKKFGLRRVIDALPSPTKRLTGMPGE